MIFVGFSASSLNYSLQALRLQQRRLTFPLAAFALQWSQLIPGFFLLPWRLHHMGMERSGSSVLPGSLGHLEALPRTQLKPGLSSLPLT